MANHQTIFRTTKDSNNPYVMINKVGLEDTRLSWKARGILAYLLSKPDNWDVTLEHLVKQAPDGKTAVRSGIDELKKYGYLIRVAIRENNKIVKWEFWVNETPISNPVEKHIQVDAKVLEEYLEHNKPFYIYTKEGKFLDTSLLSGNRKVGKTLDTSLLSENLEVGNLHVGNLHLGNVTLLINDNTNNDLTNNYDDDSGDSTSQNGKCDFTGVSNDESPKPLIDSIRQNDECIRQNDECSNPWEKDHKYTVFRETFVSKGADDIIQHEKHYPKFQELVEQIGFSQLLVLAEKYIKDKGKDAQICWFLGGGWKNFRDHARSARKPAEVKPLPKALQMQEEQEPKLSPEELERKKARIAELKRQMDEKLSQSVGRG